MFGKLFADTCLSGEHSSATLTQYTLKRGFNEKTGEFSITALAFKL